MALSFPLAVSVLNDLLPIESAPWVPLWNQEYSGLGSGEMVTADLAPRLWSTEVTSKPLKHSVATQLMAVLGALDGALNTLYLCDPLRWYPQADHGGVIYGASTPAIHTVGGDNKSMRLKSLPSTYVVTRGDLIAVDYDSPSRRAVFEAVATVTAVAGVTPTFEVRPHIRPGIVVDLAVNLVKAAAKVKILPSTLVREMASTTTSRLRFSVRQTLQKG